MTADGELDRQRRPTVCVGVITGGKGVDGSRQLLIDLTRQTERPSEVLVVLQGGLAPHARLTHAEALIDEFPALPLSVRTNPGQALSVAKNIVLRDCSSDVMLCMDDDVRLKPRAVEDIASSFGERPETAIIISKVEWVGGGAVERKYPREERRFRTVWPLAPVVSVELAAAVRHVERLGVRFDEHFGLGSEFGTGEEFIFAADVLHRGGQVRYVPIEIATHPARTSGDELDRQMMVAKGAVYRRVFGPFGVAVGAAVVLRKKLSGLLGCRFLDGLAGIVDGWRRWGLKQSPTPTARR